MARAGIALGLLLVAFGAWAQTENLGLVVRDGSIGPEVPDGEDGVVLPGDGADYLIYEELGDLSGNNLFHSFKYFSIGAGEIARFTGSASIANIISRVNGETGSELLGRLESTAPNANLFLLNPYGVVFGPNSELDVQGSFYVSTADVLRFEDDGPDFFTRETTRPETLASTRPESFGFLQEPTGTITFERAQLAVNEGRTLSAVGGEILVFGGPSPSLAAPGGRVQLVSVASPDVTVPLNASEFDVGGFEAEALGDILLTDRAVLQVNSESEGEFGTGRIVIRGGRFVMSGGGLYAKTPSPSETPPNDLPGDATAIDVAVSGDIRLDSRALIQSWSQSGGGSTGDIKLAGDQVIVQDRAVVAAVTSSAATGAGIDVDANQVAVDGRAQIFTRSSGDGDAGALSISGRAIEGEGEAADRAESVTLAGEARLWTRGSASGQDAGQGGRIELAAQTLEISGDGTEIFSLSEGDSTGRAIDIDAGRASVADGGRIFSEAQGNEAGAAIYIDADGVGVADPEAFALEVTARGAITSLTTADGAGGAIDVHAANARVTDGGQIASENRGDGDGGSVSIEADGELELAGEGQITTLAASTAGGSGGDLTVHAGSLTVTGGEDPDFVAQISALTASTGQLEGDGRGGDLMLEVGSVELIDGGQLRATTDGDAAAGDLTLTVREGLRPPSSACQGVCIRGVSLGGARPSGIFATSGSDPDTPAAEQATGDGGDLVVNALVVRLENGGEISASTLGTGDAGSLTIWNEGANAQLVSILGDPTPSTGEKSAVATQGSLGSGGDLKIFTDDLELVDGGEVTASTSDSGESGSVVIEAQRVLVEGENRETPSGVFAQTLSRESDAGNAGSVDITARESLKVVDGGQIGAASFGGGVAGNVTIRGGGAVEVARGGLISTLAAGQIREASPETASNIVIADAAQLTVASGGTITAETHGNGFGGTIDIDATSVELIDSTMTAQTRSTGAGGSIDIDAGDVRMTGGTMTAETSGTGQGGSIDVGAETVDLSGAEITARSTGDAANSGNAGEISVRATRSFRMAGSEISTEALEAAAGDITLSGGQTAEITNQSLVSSLANGTGNAGDIFVVDTQTVSISGQSVVTAETHGAGTGGTITFQDVGDVFLSGGSSITTKSTATEGGGAAGDIIIAAQRTFQAENSSITTTAENAGGGRIAIQGGKLVYLLDSLVKTTVNGNDDVAGADAGDIDIPLREEEPGEPLELAAAAAGEGLTPVVPEFVVINRSIIEANANATDAGNITIAGDYVLISSDSHLEATSDKGVSGEIQISSPDADVVSQVTPLPTNFVDASDRLLPPCVARTERTGSFVVQNREALPPPPDAPLSPALAGASPASDSEKCSVSEECS